MLVPVFARQFSGHRLQLLGKVIAGNIIGALKHGLHRIQMALLQLPQPGGAGMFAGASIGNIKHISQARLVAGIVHQSNPFGTAPYIPAHLFIP